MSIDNIVDIEERELEKEEKGSSIAYDDSYRNKTHLNVMMTDAEMIPLPQGIYGMHVVERVKSYINDILRSDVLQKYRTETHEQLHKILPTACEYVVRTLEAFISGVELLRDRYTRKPRYMF